GFTVKTWIRATRSAIWSSFLSRLSLKTRNISSIRVDTCGCTGFGVFRVFKGFGFRLESAVIVEVKVVMVKSLLCYQLRRDSIRTRSGFKVYSRLKSILSYKVPVRLYAKAVDVCQMSIDCCQS